MHARTVAAAQHLFRSQQYTGVAALCEEALEIEPDNLELRILRVRALLALRRDEEATRELSRILRWGSETAEVFRLLGELAIRRGKLHAAETFLRQSLKLAPDDRKTQALLELVQSSNQPTVAVEKLPAATATVGCTLSPEDDFTLAPPDGGEAPDVIGEIRRRPSRAWRACRGSRWAPTTRRSTCAGRAPRCRTGRSVRPLPGRHRRPDTGAALRRPRLPPPGRRDGGGRGGRPRLRQRAQRRGRGPRVPPEPLQQLLTGRVTRRTNGTSSGTKRRHEAVRGPRAPDRAGWRASGSRPY